MDVYHLLVANLVCHIENAIAESIETVELQSNLYKIHHKVMKSIQVLQLITNIKRMFARCEKIEVLLNSS